MKSLFAAHIQGNQLVDPLFLVTTKSGSGRTSLGAGGESGTRIRQERLGAGARASDLVSRQNPDSSA
jgi:hypothetical protein